MTDRPAAPPRRYIPFAIYLAYLASFFTGVGILVGVVLAYIERGSGPAWLETHFRYQIRTFWIFWVYFCIGTLFWIVLLGWLTWMLAAIWLILRCAKGLSLLDRGVAMPDPGTWWI